MGEHFTHSPFADTTHTQASEPDGPVSLVPPPPTESIEVSIRTLASDLETMAKQGGSAIQAIAMARPEHMVLSAPQVRAAPQASHKDMFRVFVWFLVGGVGTVVLFAIGYSVIPLLLPGSNPASLPRATSTLALPSSTPVVLSHVSLFGSMPDEKMTLSLAAGTPQSLGNQIFAVLQNAKPESTFVEVEIKDPQGSAVTWPRFLELIGAPPQPVDFWADRFEQDFTLFARRTGGGFVVGYALKLKSGVSPLVLRQDLLQLEANKAWVKALLLQPLADWATRFEDAQVAGQPVRLLRTGTSTPEFLYGLPYNRFWVIATSQDSFREALPRLGSTP